MQKTCPHWQVEHHWTHFYVDQRRHQDEKIIEILKLCRMSDLFARALSIVKIDVENFFF